jgi:hypothetical protein
MKVFCSHTAASEQSISLAEATPLESHLSTKRLAAVVSLVFGWIMARISARRKYWLMFLLPFHLNAGEVSHNNQLYPASTFLGRPFNVT